MRIIHFRRILSLFLVAASLSIAFADHAEARSKRSKRFSEAKPKFAAMVVDAQTGKTLYAKDQNEIRYPASVTKVMTLYLLFEALDRKKLRLDSQLKVSNFASRQAPSKAGVRAGDTISVEEAILALVTKSANDVAVTVAENLGGSESAFARQMTRKAHALGMKRTNYQNASGLPNPRQVTTASDLIKLSIAIQKHFPQYYPYFSTAAFNFRGQYFGNHNKLLGNVEGVDGIKTGYTRASGFNLMTSAKTNGRHIVAVVLGGRTGAQRDAAMRQLVAQYLPVAYAARDGQTKLASLGVPELQGKSAEIAIEDDQESTSVATPKKKQKQAVQEVAQVDAIAIPKPEPVRDVVAKVSEPAVASANVANVPVPLISPKFSRVKVADITGSIPEQEATTKSEVVAAKKDADWLIQVGALPSERDAKSALNAAKSANQGLAKAEPYTEKVSTGSSVFYRARFAGLARAEAQNICNSLKKNDVPCVIMRN